MEKPLAKEFQFFLENQESLIKEYNGKVVVIKDNKILGAYDSEIEAINKTKLQHTLGTFLVQRVAHGDSGYTQTFHSRVSFS